MSRAFNDLASEPSMSHSQICFLENPLHYFLVLIEKEHRERAEALMELLKALAHRLSVFWKFQLSTGKFSFFLASTMLRKSFRSLKSFSVPATSSRVPSRLMQKRSRRKTGWAILDWITYMMLFVHFIQLSISLHARHKTAFSCFTESFLLLHATLKICLTEIYVN